MRTTLDEKLKELPLERQKKIEARAAELIAEEAERQQRRKQRRLVSRRFFPWQLEQIYKAIRIESPHVEQGKNLILSSLLVRMGEKTRK
ncbi:MAG: hypothetical protein V7L04_14035 [Nostoc sp.]|uniref:hypothetical protein n=1 Tax=Nostoc sp. TaxID=1180 RepID=UPI002FF64487